MKKILTKKEVAGILEVTPRALRSWSEEKINEELLKKACLEVLQIQKVGRSIEYTCKYKEVSMSNKDYLKDVFNVKNVDGFINYSKEKINNIENEKLDTREQLCSKTDTVVSTSKNYDRKLEEKGVFSKDGYIYICKDKKTGSKVLSNKSEYNNFWIKNNYLQNELKSLAVRFRNKEIAQDDYNYISSSLLDKTNGDWIYYKLSKIVVEYDNELTKLILNN